MLYKVRVLTSLLFYRLSLREEHIKFSFENEPKYLLLHVYSFLFLISFPLNFCFNFYQSNK